MNWLREFRGRITHAVRLHREPPDATRDNSARAALIDRKAAVQAEAAQIRRELGRLRASGQHSARPSALEVELGRLAAEEHRLRLQIDRSRHGS
jgi:hypothetical protein